MDAETRLDIKDEDRDTNELEILEFKIGDICFGINVVKVREILNIEPITKIPDSHHSMEGMFKFRGEVITMINLNRYLDIDPSGKPEKDKIIVAEFNLTRVAFRVNSVDRIHRVTWEQLHKTPEFAELHSGYTTGILKMPDGRIILMLDFEKIIIDINPSILDKEIKEGRAKKSGPKTDKIVVIAEDSPTLRQILLDYLPDIGYTNLKFFENGLLAWKYLYGLVKEKEHEFLDEVCLMITDIEMPQMGGHHLTNLVKQHPILRDLPIVIFSSLITNDLRHKGESVGANAQVSKPHFKDLSVIIDGLLK